MYKALVRCAGKRAFVRSINDSGCFEEANIIRIRKRFLTNRINRDAKSGRVDRPAPGHRSSDVELYSFRPGAKAWEYA